jgi:hypothetical protein
MQGVSRYIRGMDCTDKSCGVSVIRTHGVAPFISKTGKLPMPHRLTLSVDIGNYSSILVVNLVWEQYSCHLRIVVKEYIYSKEIKCLVVKLTNG